jgi:hypothetical protein
LLPGDIASVGTFGFERGVEALLHSIVVAIANSTHTYIWCTALITVVNEFFSQLMPPDGHFQGIRYDLFL